MSGERDLLVSCREDMDPERLRTWVGELRPMVLKLALGAKLSTKLAVRDPCVR